MQNSEKESQSWLKLFFIMLWLFLYGMANVVGGSSDININTDDTFVVALIYVSQFISVLFLFVLPAILFSVFWTKEKIHYLGVSVKPVFLTLIVGSIGMLMALPTINYLAELNAQMQLPEAFASIEMWMKETEAKAAELTAIFTGGTSIGKLILNLFVIAFMAAFSEELFFRGILQKVLTECFKNKHIGVWIAALVFSAFHMQFYGFIPRMLMGAYLGYLFMWSGSIWPSMFVHFMNNAMAVFITWLVNKGVISAEVDKVGSSENQMVYVVVSFIVVILSLVWVYKIENKKKSLANT